MTPPAKRPLSDRRFAALVGLVAFVAYLFTLPPSFGMWDTAELQTVVAILGIAHPPGDPAFVLLGYAFTHVFAFGDVAWRVGLMCSLCVAGSVSLAYAAARYFRVSQLAAIVCSLGFAFSLVVWRDATRVEASDVALLARTLAIVFGLRWYSRGSLRDLFMMALTMSLAFASHELSVFLIPSLAILACARREVFRANAVGVLLAGFVLGLTPYAYLPLRSLWIDAHHLEPLAVLGLPPGQAFWNYDDPSNWPRFVQLITGADFHVQGGFDGFLAFGRYFQFASRLSERVADAYGWAGTMLALGGAVLFVISRKPDRAAIVLAALLPVPYTESYSDLQDPERYYLLLYWCAALLMAVAFDRLAGLFELRIATIGRSAAAFALAVSFAFVGPERIRILGQHDDLTGPIFAATIASVTPDDAIILADWAYAAPLAYDQYVNHALGKRTIVPASSTQYLAQAAVWAKTRPLYFVGFDSDLHLAGWHVKLVKATTYYAYRLTK